MKRRRITPFGLCLAGLTLALVAALVAVVPELTEPQSFALAPSSNDRERQPTATAAAVPDRPAATAWQATTVAPRKPVAPTRPNAAAAEPEEATPATDATDTGRRRAADVDPQLLLNALANQQLQNYSTKAEPAIHTIHANEEEVQRLRQLSRVLAIEQGGPVEEDPAALQQLRERTLSLLDAAETQIDASQWDRARFTLHHVGANIDLLRRASEPLDDLQTRQQYLTEQLELLKQAAGGSTQSEQWRHITTRVGRVVNREVREGNVIYTLAINDSSESDSGKAD